jgi:hypothetical protein
MDNRTVQLQHYHPKIMLLLPEGHRLLKDHPLREGQEGNLVHQHGLRLMVGVAIHLVEMSLIQVVEVLLTLQNLTLLTSR